MKPYGIILLILSILPSFASAVEISFTMDDPEVNETPLLSPQERNERILAAFHQFKTKGALFVCGMRIDNPSGKKLLQDWDKNGHLIGSHSYSHLYFNAKKTTFESYRDDFLRVEPLLQDLKNFENFFRFPYLKEGETREKRDQMRAFLRAKGYRQGYVTIDASDWYVDARMIARLKKDPKADLRPYRDFYLKHMWNRALYYNELAKKIYGREIKHTILIHHSLLNALFLGDLMQMFQDKGWKLISAKTAFEDPIFKTEPNILPAGESIVWAAAKEAGSFDAELRYPGEDSEYEKAEMDQLGL